MPDETRTKLIRVTEEAHKKVRKTAAVHRCQIKEITEAAIDSFVRLPKRKRDALIQK